MGGEIIRLYPSLEICGKQPDDEIDVRELKKNTIKLKAGLIAPSAHDVEMTLAPEHDAEPIKSMEDIFRISTYLIDHGKYRDNMLFIVGINFGLRASDLRMLRFCDLINDNCTFKQRVPVFEKKTRNTRKRKKNRYITINQAVIEAVTLYLEHTPGVTLSDYMFPGRVLDESGEKEPLQVRSMNLIFKKIHDDLELNFRFSSHSLRKTFGYHQMVMSGNDPRTLLLLQKIFGHSTSAQTLEYIGITSEEIDAAYKALNLGSKQYNYLTGNRIVEEEATTADVQVG